jgi:CRISPR-associated endonuclease Cas1
MKKNEEIGAWTDRALLFLILRARQRIFSLPHYHGPQWNGMFRHLARQFICSKQTLNDLKLRIHPVDTGMSEYFPGETIHLGISIPVDIVEPFFKMIRCFNFLPKGAGPFHPGTLAISKVLCRVSGRTLWESQTPHTALRGVVKKLARLTPSVLAQETRALTRVDRFTLRFYAPLSLKASSPYREMTGHATAGYDFFFNTACNPLDHLLSRLGAGEHHSKLTVTGGQFNWYDCKYGKKYQNLKDPATTMGGILGFVTIEGTPGEQAAAALVRGQYLGVGKSRTFGFGFYHIPELEGHTGILPFSKSRTLIDRAFSHPCLKTALTRLPDSSPGPDGLLKEDLLKAGPVFLNQLSTRAGNGVFAHGPVKSYKMKKKQGGFRPIHVFNMADKLLHRAISDTLSPVSEKILSDASFAYRSRRNRKQASDGVKSALKNGYVHGLKADIHAFFDSIDPDILTEILSAILPFDDLPLFVSDWLKHCREQGISGLPQGSPLSPVLSNLYLDRFDRELLTKDCLLFRYGDDFILLFKDKDRIHQYHEGVIDTLSSLGLKLNPQKTLIIEKDTAFSFLGYEISLDSIKTISKETDETAEVWLPVFTDSFLKGKPVYLSSLCRGAFSSGPSLVINDDQSHSRDIPWNTISRIVVVGRSSFSSGMVYRAIKQNIPVTFIDVMGRLTGQVTSTDSLEPAHQEIQTEKAMSKPFCLAFSKQIIHAKILNCRVLLRRNGIRHTGLRNLAASVEKVKSPEQLLGFEGQAAKQYYSCFKTLVKPFTFDKRVFHPPDNPVNALLSFGYTLLYNRLSVALMENGLNPRKGFFHKSRGRHNALASDLMEELRHVIDRIVLALIHLKEIQEKDFSMTEYNGRVTCRMNGPAFRKYIQKYEAVMMSTFSYGRDTPISYNAYLDEMALGVIRCMKLSIPYQPLIIK